MNRKITKLLKKYRDMRAIRNKANEIIRYQDNWRELKHTWNCIPKKERCKLCLLNRFYEFGARAKHWHM